MITTTAPPESLVIKLPRLVAKKPPNIIPMPADISPIDTAEATTSGAGIPPLSNHLTRF